MADKQVPLSIIIRTVDKATAGIQAINKELDELTKPTREFGKALRELGEKSGFNRVGEAFHEVGKAAKETFIKLLEGAAIIGETTHLVLEMVESFAALNDTAESLGTTVDALAGLRYAASKSGASVEELDQGLRTFVANLGGLKAGTGKLTKFLGEVAPTMLTQLKATRTTEEALGILAAGMEHLTNKAKQLKFAQEALGDPKLAVLFHKGPRGIMELMEAYAKLAGPQQEAAERAAKVDDAMKDLHAATEGVKAALVTGLSPALTEIIDKLTLWLSGHREDVARWAEDLGKRLPKAVEELVDWLGKGYDRVMTFVGAIGGWNVAVVALAAVIAGPLIASVAALGVALLATPFGQVLLALTPIVAAIAALVSETEAFEAVAQRLGFSPKKKTEEQEFKERQDAMMEDGRRAAKSEANARAALDDDPVIQKARMLADQRDAMLSIPDSVDPHEARMAALRGQIDRQSAAHPGPQEVKIKVDFANAPKGMRADVAAAGGTYVDMTTGYNMGGGGW